MNIQRYIARTTVLLATLLMQNACSDEHTNEYFADNSHTLLRVSLSHFSAEGQAHGLVSAISAPKDRHSPYPVKPASNVWMPTSSKMVY